MTTTPYEFESEFMNRVVNHGITKGEATAILLVLESRNIAIDEADRKTITACTDTDQLQTWIRRAATADTIEDVLR